MRKCKLTPAQWHYLDKKLAKMMPFLKADSFGLDMGCGRGEYTVQLAKTLSCNIIGIDISEPSQNTDWATFFRQDMRHTTFPYDYFDYVYAINSVHHLPSRMAQYSAFSEAERVLKPGGLFFLHEMNVGGNPVLRAWLRYVFSLYSEYDDGSELWVKPDGGGLMPKNMTLIHTETFTFVPDLTPTVLLPLFGQVEAALERTWLKRFGAHYMSVWRKT